MMIDAVLCSRGLISTEGQFRPRVSIAPVPESHLVIAKVGEVYAFGNTKAEAIARLTLKALFKDQLDKVGIFP